MTFSHADEDYLESLLGKPASLSAEWIIRPVLRRYVFPSARLGIRSGKLPIGSGSANRIALHSIRSGFARYQTRFDGLSFVLDNERRLWVWNTVNQSRAFGGGIYGHETRSLRSVTQSTSSTRFSKRIHNWLIDLARRQREVDSDDQIIEFSDAWAQYASFLSEASESALQALSPSAVILANQHLPEHRSIIASSRRQGIPTVYLPHAPMATNRQYADLPVDYASAFGRGEVEVLKSFGADTSRVRVCGNPAMKLPESPTRETGPNCQRRIVAAPSPVTTGKLAWFFSSIRSACGDDFDICLHPRLPPDRIRKMIGPSTRVVSDIRTLDYIANTSCILIHMNSGVGLEAMAAGVPSINLIPPDSSPSYFYLLQDSVLTATSDSELGVLTRSLVREQEGYQQPQEMFGRDWLMWTGNRAETEIESLLASVTKPVGPIFDGWA